MRFSYQIIPFNELTNPTNQEDPETFYLSPITRAGFEEEIQRIFGSEKPIVLLYGVFYIHEIDLQRMEHGHFLLYESNDALICSSIPNNADGYHTALRAIHRELEFPSTDPE